MGVIHHYGCHSPLNKIWSNNYIYFILIQIRHCRHGVIVILIAIENYNLVCNSNSHVTSTIFIQRQIVIVMECEVMCNTCNYVIVHLVSIEAFIMPRAVYRIESLSVIFNWPAPAGYHGYKSNNINSHSKRHFQGLEKLALAHCLLCSRWSIASTGILAASTTIKGALTGIRCKIFIGLQVAIPS